MGLLYGAVSWKVTETVLRKIGVFQRKCLRSILRIFWPNVISNDDLYARTNFLPLTDVILKKRWRGHVLRMPNTENTKVALFWTPDGKRKRGRPKETWRRTVAREMKEKGWSWKFLETQAKDRTQCLAFL